MIVVLPPLGGTSGYTQYLHIVNSESGPSVRYSTGFNTTCSDYYDNVGGHAVDAEVGAVALTEGNYFVRHLPYPSPLLISNGVIEEYGDDAGPREQQLRK